MLNPVIISDTCVKFRPSVRNLGVTLDSTFSLHQHVMNACRVAYIELKRINLIRNLLSIDAVKTLVYSLVLSRIDSCNSLLVGLPQYLQGVQNATVRSIFRIFRTLFLRCSYPEHSQHQTIVLWSAFFCLPWSHCMEFFATCNQTPTGI